MKKKYVAILTVLVVSISFFVLWRTQANYATLKSWSSYDILTAADLNSNFTLLNTALDSLKNKDIPDSIAAALLDSGYVYKAVLGDSTDAWLLRNTSLQRTADTNDSINARLNTSFLLPWSLAFADSIAANDSLTVEIFKDTPIGDGQGLFIRHALGVKEKVALYLDFQLPNALSVLDSIAIPLWTETTNTDNYAAFSVWDDSTDTAWESKLTAAAPDSASGSARTTKLTRVVVTGITGGRVRLKGIVSVKADSTFIGMPIVYVRNP